MKIIASFTFISLLLLGSITGVAGQTISVGSKVPVLALKDQYEHEIKLSDYKGQIILIVCGDRTGNEYMSNWVKEVRKQYPGGPDRLVTIVPVANLKGVPGFLQGFVKGKFQKKTPEGKPGSPVLLDWKGEVAKTFGFHDNLTNVYLVDGAGSFRFFAFGKGEPAEVPPLLRAIGEAVASSPKSAPAKSPEHLEN